MKFQNLGDEVKQTLISGKILLPKALTFSSGSEKGSNSVILLILASSLVTFFTCFTSVSTSLPCGAGLSETETFVTIKIYETQG